MSFAETARQKVLRMAAELGVESQRIGVMRSVDATETSRWLAELAQALRDACRDLDEEFSAEMAPRSTESMPTKDGRTQNGVNVTSRRR